MNAALASLVKQSLLGAGHYSRRLRRDAFPGVAVLCYHGVRADDLPEGRMHFENLHVRASELEAHCRFVRGTCHPISLDHWRQALAGSVPLPARPVLFTFDDGYRSVLTLARPILERYAIPAVAFVCSEPVERQQLLWYDAMASTQSESEVERLKEAPFEEWAERAAATQRTVNPDDPRAPLSVSDVKTLARSLVEIGAHSAAHAVLGRAAREQQRAAIVSNKASLETWIGRPVRAFAYPNGRPGQDYTDETVSLVRDSGFDFAFTTSHGFATEAEPPLERSRFVMVAGISPAELAHRLAYSWRR